MKTGSANNESLLLYNVKLSSVVPATVTGEINNVHELTDMDLAMKLHYIQGVYFFPREAVEGLTIGKLKEPMFKCLDLYTTVSGRVRRSETGRPFIKCNDSGVRIVEAECVTTIEEFLDMKKDQSFLVYNQVLGPDLAFSPLVIMQFTWFKCGGISLGLSWAHVLGDAFSATSFVNMWAKILSGQMPPKCMQPVNLGKSKSPPSVLENLVSTKRVDPLGDHWLIANNSKMETNYFQITAKQLEHLLANVCAVDQAANISRFEVLSAIIWRCLSEIREDCGPRIIAVCTSSSRNRENEYPTNGMVLSTVEADFSVAKADISAVVELIAEKRVEYGMGMTEEIVEKENGEADYIAYGANLTFVNLEEAEIYGLELKGQKPVFVNYAINGVGDEGVVLVLPGAAKGKAESGGRDGVTVTMVLPENQFQLLRNKLERDWMQ
ncbi:hypothetical protein F2P56_025501 [Juglans regia]|uniref:Protein ECERIFERUM 2 n=2 Tax=Juglans regia TaxID=51240 RepID=A0A833UF17_JUGRE|nr:protein ECERIFERUM 2-like [Juglans regia]KAF5455982.1 hypothetical protein F2P56_025501 [Juglans regia]